MICYLDSSAMVKLYVEENGSDLAKKCVQDSLLVATSKVAYAEVMAAFARAWREEILGQREYKDAVANFKEDWPEFFALDVSNAVLQRVDDVIDRYNLRGFDALHLASALVLSRRNEGEEIWAACWDSRLWDSFRQEGFLLIPKIRPGGQA